jgi:endonuclease III
MSLKRVHSLAEIVEAVKEDQNPKKILLSQHETSRSAVTLGDEDTESGTRLRVKVVLEDSLYYSEEFTDDTLYEEANELIQELKETAQVTNVSEKEIEQAIKE